MWGKLKLIKVKYVFIGLLLVSLLAQLIQIDKNEPTHLPQDDILIAENAYPEVVKIMHSACYDCHSYETQYPWYSSIAPISWWTKNHVNEARQSINFSDWTHFSRTRQDKKLHECMVEIQEGKMPLKSYTYLHREAILTDAQRQTLLTWFQTILAR